jgi:NAD(P)-dependent dehydrogenase (short-subunit alcohol dehydrogenase family)
LRGIHYRGVGGGIGSRLTPPFRRDKSRSVLAPENFDVSFASYPSLKGRVVFITGGGSGIGAALVEAFAGQGARVAFVDILEAQSRDLAARLGGGDAPPLFIPCDLLDVAALGAAMTEVRARLGPISVLVNNAGNDTRQKVDDVTEADWDRTMALNLKHQFFAAKAARPQMREIGGGSIVNFSSIAWMGGAAPMVAYATAKAAIVGLTNSLARAFGADNIRVNAIAPGAVITERQRRLWISESDLKAIVAQQCLGRVLLADEIARAVLFLAADDSAMITKQCLVVDGGLR